MSIGFGIGLFVVGAILAFAVNLDVSWIDLDLVGYLLMGAGVLTAMIGGLLLVRRRSSVVTERTSPDGMTRERVVSETRETNDTAV